MIRLSVLYPAGDDVTFDVDYYKTSHRALCERILGCEKVEVDTAITGPYVAVGHFFFPSMDALQAGMAHPDAAELTEDVKNYTNATPVMQISEVVSS
jgi:uncharacterized protein (TIGR02118 family)